MPSQDLKVALLPIDIVPFDSDMNLEHVASRLDRLEADTGLVVLPEMFNSGFTPDAGLLDKIAQQSDGRVLPRLCTMACRRNMAICGSLVVKDEGKLFNRGFIVLPDGRISFYDKHHLFSAGSENDIITAGEKQSPVIEFRSWNLKMSICYDIRFPIWNRSRSLDYDVLIVPANWPHSRVYAWEHMLIARAIENQTYVLGCNREGRDHYGEYQRGDSMILDNWGKSVGKVCDDGTVYATLEADRFNAARNFFTPWRDADDFAIL